MNSPEEQNTSVEADLPDDAEKLTNQFLPNEGDTILRVPDDGGRITTYEVTFNPTTGPINVRGPRGGIRQLTHVDDLGINQLYFRSDTQKGGGCYGYMIGRNADYTLYHVRD